MDYLRLCAIVKDEEVGYLQEWVDYHLRAGFEHICLYDNGSQVSVRQVLREAIHAGRLHVVDAPGKGMQHSAYTHCLQFYGQDTHWLAFIDLDEFILPRSAVDLKEFLQPYESHAALGIHWLLFGSGGHQRQPGTSQIEHFVMRTPETYANNSFIKSIVQPTFCLMPLSAHHFLYRGGRFCVDEQFQRLDGQEGAPTAQHIAIHHYYCRSREEFERKIRRGKADDGYRKTVEIPMQNFEAVDRSAIIEDTGLKERWSILQKEVVVSSSSPAAGNEYPLRLEGHHVLVERFLQVLEQSQQAAEYDTVELLLNTMPSWYGGMFEWHLGLGRFFIENRMDELAWQQLLAAWHLQPRSSAVLNLMGRYYTLRKEGEKAEKAYAAVLEQDQQDIDALLALAELYRNNGRVSEALLLFEKAQQFKDLI